MVGRKRINPATVLYEIDANHRRRVLGPPGDPKKHVPKLLRELRDKKLNLTNELIARIKDQFPKEYELERDKLDLKHPEFVAMLFELATKIDAKEQAIDRAVAVAFEKAGLNVASPMDWRLLMERFCWAHFGEVGEPGAHVFWTDDKYRELLRDVHRMKVDGYNSEAEALRKIKTERGKKYNGVSADRLKKALAEARNLDFNTALKKPTYELLSKESGTGQLKDDSWPAFSDTKSLLKWLADKDAAREAERLSKIKATARSIADRIGAGENF